MKIMVSIVLMISMLLGANPLHIGITLFDIIEIRELAAVIANFISLEKESENVIEEEPVAKGNTEEAEKSHVVTFLTWDDKVDFTVEVKYGESLSYIPDSVWEDGIFEKWTRVDNGETFRADTPIYEDVVYEPNYIYLEWFVLNALENGQLELKDCDPDEIRRIAEYIRTKCE